MGLEWITTVNVIDEFFRAIIDYVYATPYLANYFNKLFEEAELENRELS